MAVGAAVTAAGKNHIGAIGRPSTESTALGGVLTTLIAAAATETAVATAGTAATSIRARCQGGPT
jgi:hypothetical protein